jgi:hypothetical protein
MFSRIFPRFLAKTAPIPRSNGEFFGSSLGGVSAVTRVHPAKTQRSFSGREIGRQCMREWRRKS